MDSSNLVEEILLRLKDGEMVRLKSVSKELSELVKNIENDQEYWRKRLSNYLGFEVFDRVGETWKKMYENVVEMEKDFLGMVRLNYLEIIAGLIKQGIDPSMANNKAVRLAAFRGNFEIVKLLLEDPRVDPAAGDNYAIRFASYAGRTEIVKLLLEDPRIDPSAQRNEAIRWASARGYYDVVKLLLESLKVNLDTDNSRAIYSATNGGYVGIVKLLLKDPRIDPAVNDNSAIQRAFTKEQTEIVKLLIRDPRVRNSLSSEEIEKYSKLV